MFEEKTVMCSKTSRGKIFISFANNIGVSADKPLESKGGELTGWLGEVHWLPLRGALVCLSHLKHI